MTKEEKLVVIDSLAEQLQAYPHFYIADIEALNAEQTAALRRFADVTPLYVMRGNRDFLFGEQFAANSGFCLTEHQVLRLKLLTAT